MTQSNQPPTVGHLGLPANPPQVIPRHKAAHVLRKGNLVIEVMDPNDPQRYNRGVRFSPVATILRAVMDGKDFLFSPVDHKPLTENCGIPIEFDLCTIGGTPPGFSEAKMGEGFLKIGVGVLRKNREDYSFFAPYEIIEQAQTKVEWAADKAAFQQTCGGINGYAYSLSAEIVLGTDTISVACTLINTGSKKFSTEQYAHDYFCFDDKPIGPGYDAEYPFDFTPQNVDPVMEQKGRALVFVREFPKTLEAINAKIVPTHTGPRKDAITFRHNSMQLTASVSLQTSRQVIHATPRYFCPEQFVPITLEPGKTATWTRLYVFQVG